MGNNPAKDTNLRSRFIDLYKGWLLMNKKGKQKSIVIFDEFDHLLSNMDSLIATARSELSKQLHQLYHRPKFQLCHHVNLSAW